MEQKHPESLSRKRNEYGWIGVLSASLSVSKLASEIVYWQVGGELKGRAWSLKVQNRFVKETNLGHTFLSSFAGTGLCRAMEEILHEKNPSVFSRVTRPGQIFYKHTRGNLADWKTALSAGSLYLWFKELNFVSRNVITDRFNRAIRSSSSSEFRS